MNKKVLFAVFALLVCFLIVSCDENQQLIINPTTPSPTIRGTVSIPEGADLSGSDFYIRVMEGEKAVYTGRVNADGSFSVPGLSEEATYSILLTTEEPGDIRGTERDVSRATTTSGYGGWLSNVTASINEQAGVGSIKVKPLGTIKGVVKKDGAEDNYDTTVYIPGTSYLSMTDGEGNFSLFNVPQATYTLRYISNGYMAKMVENVVLYSESDTENPVTTVQRQTLIKNAGNLIGTISKIGSSDHSNITVMISDGENVYTGSTGTDGSLMITGILPGTYSATISASGFITQTVENLKIEAAKNTTINPISLTANGGDIKGSVIMNDGGEKAGVLITARSSDEKYSYTTSTDSEGKFTISNAYSGTYSLTLSKTDYAIITKTGVQSIAGQETNTGVFTFSSDYGTIEGTVTDSKGNPIENSIVKIGDITVFTNNEGKFSKTGIPVGSHQVTISQNGYTSQTLAQQIAIESSKTVNIGTIKLSSLYGTISGTVSVNDGRSTEGITVTVSATGMNSMSTKTDKNGGYSISSIQPGTYMVSSSVDGYASATRSVAITADSITEVDVLALTSLYGSIEATVSYSDSDETSGITVTLYNSEDQKLYETITTDSLTVSFNGISVGTDYRVVAEAVGYGARAKAEINVTSAGTTVITVPGLSNNCGMVNGMVTDSDGNAIENAIVKIGDISVFTGSDGRFSKSNIEVGNYTVTISKDGYTSKTLSDRITVESSRETAIGTVLLASEYGKLSGSVSVNDGGTTSGINISAISSNGNYSYSTLTDENGSYVITSVQPGTYTITAKQNGYTDTTASVDVIADRTAVAGTINLASVYGSVSGKVALADSADNSGVTVTLTFIADPTIAPTAVSGADGTYAFSNLANAGQYSVTFSKDGYVSSTGTVVTVTLGQNRTIDDVTLRILASKVSGTATLAETQDYTGISILLRATDNSVQYDATTDQQGSYVMARVKPGEYTLTVSKAGYVSKTVSDIIVESSTEKTLDAVSLLVGSRSITGSITAELRTDYSGFLVTATNLADEHKVYSAITNSSGAYTLAEMVPGEYQIVVSHTGYRTLTLPTVNVVEGTTKTIETYNVEINRGTIYGKATLEGRTSSAGVKVELLQGTIVYDTQYTDEIGDYSFYVPQGNYSGVRFSLEDFRSESNQDVMALFADNYVRVPDVELLATHNTVRGVVDVFKGLEDVENSNVTLSFDNNTQITPVVTEEDGAFVFRHVPVSDSKYYLRIARENCSDIVLQITVQAADEINLGVISMYSNTGTIKGQMVLDGEYDSSGILVSVETGTEDLTTYTDVTGRYELGGIPAGQVFTVTYSKTGWDTSTVQIDPVLEALEVRDMDSLTMTDTIAPVLESIVINSGANTTVSKSVNIQINASDNGGSGITLMQYSWTDNFSMSEWKNYDSYKTMEIPTEDNGQKTLMLRVRDKFGNMSEIKTDSIELVDQYKVYHGTLSGDDLNWTKAKSPIVITGDVTVPVGMTLIIGPGVDVLFDGDYSINIEGNIQAVGSDEERIVFNRANGFVTEITGNNGYFGDWGGINCGNTPLYLNKDGNTFTLVSGNVLSRVDLYNTKDGFSGNGLIDSCIIISTQYALKNYFGTIVNCEVTGTVEFSHQSGNNSSHIYIFGNQFFSTKYVVSNLQLVDYYACDDFQIFNNYFYGYSVNIANVGGGLYLSNCTFDNCCYWWGGGTFDNCVFVGLSDQINAGGRICFSNFIDNSSDYVVKTSLNSFSDDQTVKDAYQGGFDLRFNYWGSAYTNELVENERSGYRNNSFIFDYNDNPLVEKTDLSDYRTEEWNDAGYKGSDFATYYATCSNNGNSVTVDFTMLTDGEISHYRISQSLAGLLDSDWIPYSGTCIIPNDSIDETLLSYDGSLEVFVQCRTEDKSMPIKMVLVPFSAVEPFFCSIRDNTVIANDNVLKFDAFTYGNGLALTIDGERLECDSAIGIGNDIEHYTYSINPLTIVNGQHIMVFTVYTLGNPCCNKEITFYMNRPVPTTNEISILNDNAIVPENGTLQLIFSITNAKHLKTLSVKSGETVLFTKEYDDYKVDSLNESLSVDCSSLETGEHYVTIELLDYTGNKTTAVSDFFTVE